MGAHYKENPHQDDFLNECLDLLKDKKGYDGKQEPAAGDDLE